MSSFSLSSFLPAALQAAEITLKGKTLDSARVTTNDVIPGDVDILGITLTSLDKSRTADLTSIVKVINIYENILTPSLVAEFSVQDIDDVQNNFDIRPGDYINFSFRTPKTEQTVDLLFAISDIEDVQTTEALKLKTYKITAVSPEALRNSVLVLNFKQKDSASRLVKRIFEDHIKTGKKINVDPSKIIEDFPPISAMRPFQAINYLIQFSYSSKYNSNAFVFFENKKGYFFTTLEKLIEEGVKAQKKGSRFTDKEFFFDLASNEAKENISTRNILAYTKVSTNAFDNASKVSTIISTYDFCRGEYIKTTKKVTEEEFELLDGKNASSNDPAFDNLYGRETTSVQFIPISTDCMPKQYGEYVAKRMMFANKLEQDTVHIYVYGDTELTVGDVIKCNFPNISSNPKDQTKLQVESGNYLVTSLRHIILNTDRPQHTISMELKRNRES